jgi:hypothetical protein
MFVSSLKQCAYSGEHTEQAPKVDPPESRMPSPPFVAEHRDSLGNHHCKADMGADNCKEDQVG